MNDTGISDSGSGDNESEYDINDFYDNDNESEMDDGWTNWPNTSGIQGVMWVTSTLLEREQTGQRVQKW